MAVLSLDFWYLGYVDNNINRAVSELDKRQRDYEGIRERLGNISSDSGYLNEGNFYLERKMMELQQKMDRLNSFKTRVVDFISDAKDADERVANYIKEQSSIFYRIHGISNILAWIEDVWTAINEDYYTKMMWDFLGLLLCVVGMILGGPVAVLAAIGFVLAAANALFSTIAFGLQELGFDELAEFFHTLTVSKILASPFYAVDYITGLFGWETNFGGFTEGIFSIGELLISVITIFLPSSWNSVINSIGSLLSIPDIIGRGSSYTDYETVEPVLAPQFV